MKFLWNKRNFSLLCGVTSATVYILYNTSFATSTPLPSGSYTSEGSTLMPLQLFDIAKDAFWSENAGKFTFPSMMKYAGFVGVFSDTHADKISHWIFPSNPAELQFRPLFISLAPEVHTSKFKEKRGINFGYVVDANILTSSSKVMYCTNPNIVADGKQVPVSGSISTTSVYRSSGRGIKLFTRSVNVMPANVHFITSAKVVQYATCGPTEAGPKQVYRLTAQEHQQFKQLIGYLAAATGNPHLKAAGLGKQFVNHSQKGFYCLTLAPRSPNFRGLSKEKDTSSKSPIIGEFGGRT
jgi:hypothetical protein